MTNKYINKNGGKKLLAAIMAFAMVFVVGVVVLDSSESDAAYSQTAVSVGASSTDFTVVNDGKYLVVKDIQVTAADSASATLYVLDGKTVSIKGVEGSGAITVYAAKDVGTAQAPAYEYGGDGDNKVVVTPTGADEVLTIKASLVGQESSFILGGKVAGITSVSAAKVAESGLTVGSSTPVENLAYGLLIIDSSSSAKTIYYSVGKEIEEDVVLNATTTSVIAKNVKATIVSKDSAEEDATVNAKVVISGNVGSITFGYDTKLKITAAAITGGSFTVSYGEVSIESFTVTNATVNAYADAAIESATKVAAKYSDLTSNTAPYVYGNAASQDTITATATSVTFVDAKSSAVTITYDTSKTYMVSVTGGAKFTGNGITSIAGAVTVVKGDVTSTALTILQNSSLTISADANYTITGAITLNGKMSVFGGLNAGSAQNVNVTTNAEGDAAEFRSYAGSNIGTNVTVKLDGTGAVKGVIVMDTEDATVSGSVMGDVTYYQSQNVIVNGNYIIKNGATVTILGGFEIPEGSVVTIQNGAKIEINGSTSDVKIAGQLILEGGAQFTVAETARSVEITGVVDSAEGSTLTLNSASVVLGDGAVVTSQGTLAGSNMTVGAGAQLTVEKTVTITNISNAGELLISGATVSETAIKNSGLIRFDEAVLNGAVTISNIANDAAVVIDSFVSSNVSYKLTVNDSGLKVGTVNVLKTNNAVEITAGYASTGYSGISIVSSATKYMDGTTEKVNNKLNISGDVEIYGTPAGTLSGQKVGLSGNGIVIGDLSAGKGVIITVASGTSTVAGTLDVVNGTLTLEGKMKVDGKLVSKIQISDKLDAVEYITGTGSSKVYTYTTFKAAIDSGSKSIKVIGSVVADDITVPSGVTVDAKTAGTLTIGDDKESVVSFKDGAVLNASSVNVIGTLQFLNKNDNKVSSILSDVSVIGDVSSTYTNVYSALGGEAGKITLLRDVTFDKDVSVGEGFDLIVPNAFGITVSDGVTVTVSGTIEMNGSINGNFAEKASKTAAVITLNGGSIISNAEKAYGTYHIAGAYVQHVVQGVTYHIITTVENADEYSENITINGKVTEDVDIEIVKNQKLVIAAGAKVSLGTISLVDNAQVEAIGTIDATVSTASADFEIDGKIAVVNVPAKGEVAEHTTVSDIVGTFDVLSGTVTIADNTTAAGSIAIENGAELVIVKGKTLNVTGTDTEFTIDGTVTVNGALNSAVEVTVAGTLAVNAEDSVIDSMVVTGTVTVADGKTLKVTNTLIVGSATVGANGTIVGKVLAGNVEAYNGAELSEATFTGLVSTKFYVNDVLFATVFAEKNTLLVKDAITQDDLAQIPGLDFTKAYTWAKENGTSVDKNTTYVGAYSALYTTIATAAVDIVISVEPGIQLELDYRFYTETGDVSLSAGTYKVAAKDLAGEKSVKIIMVVDGVETVIDNGEITIDSKMIGKKVIVQASYGIAPVDPETPVDPSEDYIVSTSVVDNKVIVSVISLDGGYLVAGTEVEVTFTTLVETVAFGQTIYKPTPVTETITIGDDKPTIDNSTYELADILGDKYAVINVMSTIGTTGYGNMSLNYKG